MGGSAAQTSHGVRGGDRSEGVTRNSKKRRGLRIGTENKEFPGPGGKAHKKCTGHVRFMKKLSESSTTTEVRARASLEHGRGQ